MKNRKGKEEEILNNDIEKISGCRYNIKLDSDLKNGKLFIRKRLDRKTGTDMKQTEEERRRFQRLFFSAEEGISGIFRLPAPYHRQALANIMDMNQEGIGITFQKEECPQLVTGDTLVLIKIRDPRFSFMENIGMRIIWVLNHRSLDHMAMGCEFTTFYSDLKKRISEILNTWPHIKPN